MTTKSKLGQFYTTNYEYILSGMTIPDNINVIIEPFAGKGDLLQFKGFSRIKEIECYDIDPPANAIYAIIKRDTIADPPSYADKFLITNPPYLARNKSKDKTYFDKYDVNDLYKCLIKELLTNIPIGGILIIPLNFWSSIRVCDIALRKSFLEIYQIGLLNIFEEQVFDDTTYTVCSFQFTRKTDITLSKEIPVVLYPAGNKMTVVLNEDNNFMIGGEIYKLAIKGDYMITRLTKKNIGDVNKTNIVVKCIDDNHTNYGSKIAMEIKDEVYVDNTPNQTARTYATLVIKPAISRELQHGLAAKFNKFLGDYRNKYNSLFLTNYREGTRKRISFELVYSISVYILENYDAI
jgi:hypothetical protein